MPSIMVYNRSLEWTFAGPEGEAKIKTKGTLRVNNSEALCRALIDGLGVGRLPTFVASSHIAAGRLIRVVPQHILPEQALYAVFPERRHIPAKVRAFTDFLVDRIGGDIAYWDVEAADRGIHGPVAILDCYMHAIVICIQCRASVADRGSGTL